MFHKIQTICLFLLILPTTFSLASQKQAPDIISEEDAFFALDDQAVRDKLAEQSEILKGKNGSIMWAVDTKTGKKITEYKMESIPVWDGMAAANGSIFMSTMDGEVVCYSGKGI